MRISKIPFVIFCVIAILFGIHAYTNNTGWVFDQILAIAIMLLFLKFSRKLKLNNFTYILLGLAFLAHNAGTFGYYNVSPISIQWDHITHTLGLFAFTLAAFNFLSYKNLSPTELILITLLVGLGFGAFIEIYEFLGHLYKNNLFFSIFSGLILDKTDQGREYANSMIDLLYDSLGVIIAIVVGKIKVYFKA